MKALKIVLIAFAAVVVAVVVLLIVGMPVGFIIGPVSERIEFATGYQVRVSGGATVALRPTLAAIDLNNIKIVDPRPGGSTIAADTLRAEFSLADLVAGRLTPRDITVTRPLVEMPLLRQRSAQPPSRAISVAADTTGRTVSVPHITVTDGAVAFVDDRGKLQSPLDHINIAITSSADGQVQVDASLRPGGEMLHVLVNGHMPSTGLEALPVTFTIEMPSVLKGAVSGGAELRSRGPVLAINGITGTIGSAKFNGWASVDFSSKPLVKLDLDAQRLDLAAIAVASPHDTAADPAAEWDKPWSDTRINLDALNFVDGEVQFSVAELNADKLRLSPILLNATLQSGVAKLAVTQLGMDGGQVSGTIDVDASAPELRHVMKIYVRGVRALPLLSDMTGFQALDGHMDADFDLATAGNSQRALFSAMTGTMTVTLQDGELRNLNIAKMVRDLTGRTFSGWQDSGAEKTDFTELSAQFQVQNGHATTSNLRMLSPLLRMSGAGTADLAGKTLNFKLDPRLVLSLQGQGGTADPVGLGVPVVVEGSWGKPNIYPDIAGIFDNPTAAFGKLKELGGALLGNGNQPAGNSTGNPDIGSLIDRFTNGKATTDGGRPADQQQPDLLKQFLGR